MWAQRVLVADLREVVVAGVGVAALAVVQLVADRVVVVALDAVNIVVAQQLQAAIRIGAETAKVAQAIDRVDAASARVVDCGFQSEMIAVDAAETGDSLLVGHAVIVRGAIRLSRSDGSQFVWQAIVFFAG